jgi:hypothetical protein
VVKPVSSRAIQNLVVPLLVTVVAAFFGLFLPIAAQNTHNVFWGALYGIGFYLAGFVARGYVGNAFVGLVGLLVWPLLASASVFVLARLGHDTENYLSSHGAPLYWNLYATFY